MAMRRPAPPRLREGRPGTPTAVMSPVRSAVVGPAPARASIAPSPADASPSTGPAPTPGSGPAAVRRAPSRRALLLTGTAAAVTAAVSSGALLSRGEGSTPTASAGGGGSGDPGATRTFFDAATDDEVRTAMEWADATGVQPAQEGSHHAPEEPVTRADLALALHRFAGSPAVPLGTTPALLTDLGEDPDRAAALLWLHGRGALWGDASLQVHPGRRATRGCTASVLTALLRPALAGAGAVWDVPDDSALPHPVEPWSALAAARWLEATGIVSGVPAGFDRADEESTTRGDLALCLHRADAVIAAASA